MELCYEGALVMPKNYVVVNSEEMEYIDGGISAVAKAGIIAAIVVCGVALVAALAYGQILLAAKIMGLTVRAFCSTYGAAAVIPVVVAATGIGTATVTSAIKAVMSL